MPHKAPRAPAGAVKAAAAVARLVADVGAKAAASELKVSPSRAAAIARASNSGKPIGRVIGSKRGLEKWTGRIENVARNAPAKVKAVVKGKAAPEVHKRATTKTARASQDRAGELRAKYSDKQLAAAAGISRQKATALRGGARTG